MKAISKSLLPKLAAAALCGFAMSPASAAVFDFNVLYFGNNVASLAPGSDDPVGTMFSAGDSFTYTLTGQNGVFGTTNGGAIFPFIALAISEPGERISDFSLTLSYLGNVVFSFSDDDAVNREVHLGANTITLPGNLVFDEIRLFDNIISTADLMGGPTTTTANSILPIFGSPDRNPFYQGVVTYGIMSGVVPEPATWAMMIGGIGMIGGAMRRRKKVRTTVSYA